MAICVLVIGNWHSFRALDTMAGLMVVNLNRQITARSAVLKQEFSRPRINRGIVNSRLLRQLSGRH
jgi:hypothetical protein